jgi:DNA polymerase I-like protein with 3'-5' exonuclease and polymerase domains
MIRPNTITSDYLHALQAVYYEIGDRGICIDPVRLAQARIEVSAQIQAQLAIASAQWNCHVFIGAANALSKDDPGFTDSVNLNATQGDRALLSKLVSLGYNVPKITKKNEEGDYEQAFSTGELALQKILSQDNPKYPQGDPAIRAILKVRELGKILSVYLSARLLPAFIRGREIPLFQSTINVAGTVTGRRTSRKHTFGLGGNNQNFPKHSSSAKYFRECLVPRPGNIFLFVDQIQAEEWPVSALSQNLAALADLRTNYLPLRSQRVDRHSKLASAVFNEYIPARGTIDWDEAKHGMKRYLGKKIKHARNYGMRPPRMSESLAQEGFAVSIPACKILLEKAASVDPTVDTIFHEYIKQELSDTHILKTPFGRERMFLGARPNADNNSVFNEAYSYIPQSTVGDNTGFAVYELETSYASEERTIIQEGHDSIVFDIPEDKETINRYLGRVARAFARRIKFHNGIEIEIPISAEVGYDFKNSVELENLNSESLNIALDEVYEKRAEKAQKENEVAA